MEPFLLKPACKASIWGGTKLKNRFHKEYPGDVISESWELSVHPAGLSLADSGPCRGTPLAELIQSPAVLGRSAAAFPAFPLMIKWIDSQRPLSIQVHPDNDYAMAHENDMGKTEMWYVIDCEPDAYLYYGFSREISREEFARRIREDSLLDVVKKVPVNKGDVFFIPSGTLHAIGPGILLAEVQQSSNVTYRIYDYGRLDSDGLPRQLHIDKAIAVTCLSPAADVSPTPVPLVCPQDELLASCPYFAVVRQTVTAPRHGAGDPASFHALMCVEGHGQLQTAAETILLPAGATLFVPADSGPFTLSGNMTLLDVFVPDPALFSVSEPVSSR
ncbi:MAG: class I mannose-6-phosphate isomerase [Oscillospiraceae bacterium]|nr:class I mannose-6-phosphate isomerase [Oscillospiraceae bacterium]